MVGAVASWAGYLIRAVLFAGQCAVMAAGPLLIYYGLTLIYRPAAYVVVGLFMTWMLFKPKRGAK